jgi:hypothetical protein
MALREIAEDGSMYDVPSLGHERDFDRTWLAMTFAQRTAIEAEINRRLDGLMTSPDPNWGSITNTSIEGGKPNPNSGVRGDWSGTVFQPIFDVLGDEELAGMFYGNVWKKVIIDRQERWIGIRSDPTFPQRGITLLGKTYFLDTNPR